MVPCFIALYVIKFYRPARAHIIIDFPPHFLSIHLHFVFSFEEGLKDNGRDRRLFPFPPETRKSRES